jgi:predicted RNA-binding protein associated with RNAse of E/G family
LRHQPVITFRDGWRVQHDWHTHDVVLSINPNGRHSISSFRDAATGTLRFWYVDLVGPVMRRGHLLDVLENGLDVVVEPDLSSWHFKDEDEVEWAVSHGVYSREEADELYAEGRRAVEELRANLSRYATWLSWRPDPSWKAPQLPHDWDAV